MARRVPVTGSRSARVVRRRPSARTSTGEPRSGISTTGVGCIAAPGRVINNRHFAAVRRGVSLANGKYFFVHACMPAKRQFGIERDFNNTRVVAFFVHVHVYDCTCRLY